MYLAESTYSFPQDRQSIRRCYRIGKQNDLHVKYFTLEGERPIITSLTRKYLTDRLQDHSRMGPSSLSVLEKCPGSFWLPDTSDRMDYIEEASTKGDRHHKALEELAKDTDAIIPEHFPIDIRAAVGHYRKTLEGADKFGFEERVSAPSFHEELWGTCDFYAYKNDVLYIIDYKSGKKQIKAEDNLQLGAYALMVEETLGLKPKRYVLGITQKGVLRLEKLDNLKKYVDRITKIVDNIKEAKSAPIEHLNPDPDCSLFCTARAYHMKQEEKMAEKKPIHKAEAKIFWLKRGESEYGKYTQLGLALDSIPESVDEEESKAIVRLFEGALDKDRGTYGVFGFANHKNVEGVTEVETHDRIKLAFTLGKNEFKGKTSVKLTVRAIKLLERPKFEAEESPYEGIELD